MTKAALASGRNPDWAWMDRFDAPQYEGDGVYLTRWRVIQTPLFGIYVHRFTGPDPRRTLHDHPWPFVSIILSGGYVERRLNPTNMVVNEGRLVRRINIMRRGDAHSITRLCKNPTWSIVLAGRRARTWGYLEQEVVTNLAEGRPRFEMTHRWTWTEFSRHAHNAEFVAALKRRKARHG